MMMGLKLFFLCAIASGAIIGRKFFLLEIYVPPVVDVREKARMVCTFDLYGDHLFSLKWYKEELEFFRFMPEYFPSTQIFPVEGVHVVRNESNKSMVTLYPLDYKSSGIYRCEVSGSSPHFKVFYKQSNMTVLGLPKGNPKISGVKDKYKVGNIISANCTSSPSYPPAIMNWYINGVQAQQLYIDYYNTNESGNELNLETQVIGLKFKTDDSHFLQTKDGSLSLVCSATVGDITRSTEVRTYLSNATFANGSGNGFRNLTPNFGLMIAFIALAKFSFMF